MKHKRFGKKDLAEINASRKNEESKIKLVNDLNTEDLYKTKLVSDAPAVAQFKEKIFDLLIKHIDLNAAAKMARPELRREIERYIFEYTEEFRLQINHKELQYMVEDIINDMVGLGPLEALINDPTINDIMINSPDKVFIERKGLLQQTDVKFRNERHVLQVAQRIANQVGRRIDESSPMVDARLKDGSRVNIIIPPLALNGPSISIRKFSQTTIHLNDMVKFGSISKKIHLFLAMAAHSRLNIIVAGGTGSGKTTLLNALSAQINPKERVVTIEDAAELKLQQPHVVRLESRPANIEGQGLVEIKDLVKNALRMRPDRIIIGECRGAEAFDMIQAMNTGHDGSMSTIHSNSTQEAMSRLENMIVMSGHELPTSAIKSYIIDAVDIVVQVSRMRDGKRRVIQISEIIGLDGDRIKVRDIFSFKQTESSKTSIEGVFNYHGLSETIIEKFTDAGLTSELPLLEKKEA
ncbi:MAG: CpaF family protein [Candidatus Paracaedibacteraceae bacterium]|nr:CpaF family protein [Candidatus Paracaedibacteraceae bacterium]